MANGFGNITGRMGRGLNLARGGGGGRGQRYAGPGPNRYRRPKGFNPNLDLNDEGSANEQIAAAEAEAAEAAAADGGEGGGEGGGDGGSRGRAPGPKGMDAQRAFVERGRRTALPSRGSGGNETRDAALQATRAELRARTAEARQREDMAEQDRITALAQAARGTSQAAFDEQQRRMQMQDMRDDEAEKRRVRSIANMAGILDQRYGELREKGEIKLAGKEQAGMPDFSPGWHPKIDPETGKPRPVYVREEPSGEPGSQEMVLAFYEEDNEGNRVPIHFEIEGEDGGPVRPNRRAMAWYAQINALDRRERSGIPGRARQARADEAAIDLAGAQAEKARGEAEYARMGKPTAWSTKPLQLSGKERTQALIDIQAQLTALRDEEAYHRDRGDGSVPAAVTNSINMLTQEAQRIAALPIEGSRAGVTPPARPGVARPGGPEPGAVLDGYRFLGGDPNMQENWEQM